MIPTRPRKIILFSTTDMSFISSSSLSFRAANAITRIDCEPISLFRIDACLRSSSLISTNAPSRYRCVVIGTNPPAAPFAKTQRSPSYS